MRSGGASVDGTGVIGRDALIEGLLAAVAEAGDAIMCFVAGECSRPDKADGSPVTDADHAAEAIVLRHLAALAPEIPVVAEEATEAGGAAVVVDRFFLVDPLDGTREFIRGGNDFTVNIGLIERGAPTLGIVHAPATGTFWWGDTTTRTAFRRDADATRVLRVRAPASPPRAVASKSHCNLSTEAWLAAAGIVERVSIGSSLKFGLLAEGQADVYPRPAPTMEWDTAAGDAILRAAGGMTYDLDGAPLTYGKERFFNPGFLASGPYRAAPLRSFL